VITHLQENIATVKSDMKSDPKKTIIRRNASVKAAIFWALSGPEEIIEVLPSDALPFEGIQIGDFVKQV